MSASSADREAALAALDVPRETRERLDAFAALLAKWQRAVNLVAARTLPDLWTRHILDSAQLLPHVAARRPGGLPARWLDMGSGAGFPGLILAILGAGKVHLVDSDRRKCAFLREAVRITGADAEIHCARLEALAPFPIDILTARALAPLATLFDLALPFTAGETELWMLKGAGTSEELTRARQSWTFDAELYPSRTDPRGRILRLRGLTRADSRR